METSLSIVELTKALINVQSQLKEVKRDSFNPFHHSKYAGLASVWDSCRSLLAENGLAVIQTTNVGENHQLIVETMLVHSSGEWVKGQMPMLLSKQDPQGIGSAITYGRRYGLSAILGICPEDDDAEGAIDRGKAKTPEAQSKTDDTASSPAQGVKITEAQTRKLFAVSKQKGYIPELITSIIIRKYKTGHSKDLTKSQASELIGLLEAGYGLDKDKTKVEA